MTRWTAPAIVRWARTRANFTVAVSVSLAIVGATLANAALAEDLQRTLNRDWRGAYDILVTAPSQNFGGASTHGLVDNNFVSSAGQGGISLQQLSDIRKIEDVDVAAPVAFVGTIQQTALSPSLDLIDDPATGNSDIPSGGEVLRLTATLTQSTPTGEQTLSRSAGVVQLARRTSGEAQSVTGSPAAVGYPNGFTPQFGDLYYGVPLGQLPAFTAPVIAVDPAAERKLDGAHGSWLKKLQDLPEERGLSSTDAWSQKVDASKYLVQQTALQQAESAGQEVNVVPLIVNDDSRAKLTLHVRMEQLKGAAGSSGASLTTAQLRELMDSGTVGRSTTLTKNVSGLTVPFSSPRLNVMLPGSALPPGEDPGTFYADPPTLAPSLAGRPTYTSAGGTKYKVQPQGVVNADGSALGPDQSGVTGRDPDVGRVQSYRAPKPATASTTTPMMAPIGTFVGSDLTPTDRDATSYVPNGIYDGSTATLRSGSNAGKAVAPNLSGLDFLTAEPGAVTDLEGAKGIRGDTPIDAVRVRVSNVTGYSVTNQRRVADIAQQIANQGLKATIVAGSSLTPVSVYVPNYHITDDGSDPLGWVRQQWTSLGAVVVVSNAIGGLRTELLWLSTSAIAVGALTVGIVGGRRERQTVALLRQLGWRDSSILRRLTAQAAPTVAIVAVVSAIAAALAGAATTTTPVFTVGAAVILGGLGSVLIAMRKHAPRHSRTPSAPRGGWLVSTSLLLRRRLQTSGLLLLIQILGGAAVGTTAAVTVQAAFSAAESSGQTRLAGAVLDAVTGSATLLGVAGILGAAVLVLIGRQITEQRHARSARTMRQVGVQERDISRIARRERSVVIGATLLLAVAGTAATSALADLPLWSCLVAAAATLSLLAIPPLSRKPTGA